MSRDVVLLVEDNREQARLVAQALGAVGLRAPIHAPTGEAAVLWVGAHDCGVVLLDYDLPGINGLEVLARIRQRKPELPVIMLSNARSEEVAVAAFRGGVALGVAGRHG